MLPTKTVKILVRSVKKIKGRSEHVLKQVGTNLTPEASLKQIEILKAKDTVYFEVLNTTTGFKVIYEKPQNAKNYTAKSVKI